MGYTKLTQIQVEQVLQDISKEYIGTSYNLLTRYVYIDHVGSTVLTRAYHCVETAITFQKSWVSAWQGRLHQAGSTGLLN